MPLQAPEMFEGGRIGEKIDQYAFALLLWEALTGQLPWKNMSSPMQVFPPPSPYLSPTASPKFTSWKEQFVAG